jgi:tripartite-type tricarboxylate transporter receptor subunit TctC
MLGAAAAPLLAPVLACPAIAQSGFPARPLRIVIGFPPGGGIDILARLMGPKMSERLGQPVVVENRPGANGLIATQGVAQADADGHTILFGTTGNLAVNPVLYAGKPGMDMAREFTPLSHVASLGFVLVVNPSVRANSLKDLIDLAKAGPNELLFGSSGNGGLPHLSGELLNLQAGIKTRHVPYRGSAPALVDLLSGQLHSMFDNLPGSIGHIKNGKARALGITSTKRSAALPNVPTIAETVPGYEADVYYGIAAPKGTPAEIVAKLNAAFSAVLQDPKLKTRIAELGAEPMPMSSAEFGKLVVAQTDKWAKVIKTAGIKAK